MIPFLARFCRLLYPGIYERGRTKNKFRDGRKCANTIECFGTKLAICTRLFKPCGCVEQSGRGCESSPTLRIPSTVRESYRSVAPHSGASNRSGVGSLGAIFECSAVPFNFRSSSALERRMVHTSSSGDHLEFTIPKLPGTSFLVLENHSLRSCCSQPNDELIHAARLLIQ